MSPGASGGQQILLRIAGRRSRARTGAGNVRISSATAATEGRGRSHEGDNERMGLSGRRRHLGQEEGAHVERVAGELNNPRVASVIHPADHRRPPIELTLKALVEAVSAGKLFCDLCPAVRLRSMRSGQDLHRLGQAGKRTGELADQGNSRLR